MALNLGTQGRGLLDDEERRREMERLSRLGLATPTYGDVEATALPTAPGQLMGAEAFSRAPGGPSGVIQRLLAEGPAATMSAAVPASPIVSGSPPPATAAGPAASLNPMASRETQPTAPTVTVAPPAAPPAVVPPARSATPPIIPASQAPTSSSAPRPSPPSAPPAYAPPLPLSARAATVIEQLLRAGAGNAPGVLFGIGRQPTDEYDRSNRYERFGGILGGRSSGSGF